MFDTLDDDQVPEVKDPIGDAITRVFDMIVLGTNVPLNEVCAVIFEAHRCNPVVDQTLERMHVASARYRFFAALDMSAWAVYEILPGSTFDSTFVRFMRSSFKSTTARLMLEKYMDEAVNILKSSEILRCAS